MTKLCYWNKCVFYLIGPFSTLFFVSAEGRKLMKRICVSVCLLVCLCMKTTMKTWHSVFSQQFMIYHLKTTMCGNNLTPDTSQLELRWHIGERTIESWLWIMITWVGGVFFFIFWIFFFQNFFSDLFFSFFSRSLKNMMQYILLSNGTRQLR